MPRASKLNIVDKTEALEYVNGENSFWGYKRVIYIYKFEFDCLLCVVLMATMQLPE